MDKATSCCPAPAGRTVAPSGRFVRLRGALVAGACLAVLLVAAWLTPHASGAGTHEQLGLPTCSLLARTGWPCPTCGLTTSLAAMAHGRVGLAWKAQPFGIALFAALLSLLAAGAGEALTGRNVLARLRPSLAWVWVCLGGLVAGWGLKVLAGLADGTLPMR